MTESKTFSVRLNSENLAALNTHIEQLEDTDRNRFVLECLAACVPGIDLGKEEKRKVGNPTFGKEKPE